MVTVSSPIANNGNFRVVAGCDYFAVDGPATTMDFQQSSGAWPDLTNATACTLTVFGRSSTFTAPMNMVVRGGSSQKVRLEMSAKQTAAMPTGGQFSIIATLQNGHLVEIVTGSCSAVQA